VESLVKNRQDFIVVVTDGFVDVYSSVLSKGYALQKIAVRPLFMGRFVVAAGDGLTDEAMFDFADVGIEVGREATIGGYRVSSHYRTSLVVALEWRRVEPFKTERIRCVSPWREAKAQGREGRQNGTGREAF
jgi:trehalose-6-phosphatase